MAQSASPDARELMARGQSLIASRPAEALKLLQQALRVDPDLSGLHFQLGLAYHAIGDEADSEPEFREALSRTPDSADAHNYLGMALFGLGNAKGALEEFRAAAKLAPKDPNAHFNLGEALARNGDSNAAMEELRIATALAPSDAGLARIMKKAESELAAPEATIKVDVRQVLVPTVVTDRDGHHVQGLTQEDFRVFEDGVEQKITGFSLESSAASEATSKPVPAANTPGAAATASPAPARVRRTYTVLLDTLHVSFSDFVAARESLVRLFREERAGDSQYAVIAIGASAQLVVNVTSDPAKVLAALEDKRMQKVFQDGQLGGLRNDLDRFRKDLNETRQACDAIGAGDQLMMAKCQAGIDRAPLQAQAIAEEERGLTIGFLRQLRSMVEQLSKGRDRRTIVLVSDGFQIEPGAEALALLDAYFPVASHCMVPDTIQCLNTGRSSGGRMISEFEPILQLAAKTNITIDTIDARGLFGLSSFDASKQGASRTVSGNVDRAERNIATADGNTLAEISDATGGTAFHDSNNLLTGLQRAFADGRDYYTIAYASDNAKADGKFRAIKVQIKGHDYTINAKRGYWPTAQ
jgi:VWFA-related protein